MKQRPRPSMECNPRCARQNAQPTLPRAIPTPPCISCAGNGKKEAGQDMTVSIVPSFLAGSTLIEPTTRLAPLRLTLSERRDARIFVARVDSKRRAGRNAATH